VGERVGLNFNWARWYPRDDEKSEAERNAKAFEALMVPTAIKSLALRNG